MTHPIALIPLLFLSAAFAADGPAQLPAAAANAPVHRYLIERTFPRGALSGLDAATKKKVNANNASVGVRWIQSFANADETKTFCVYEGPSEAAVRKAAELNKLPVDSITEVPVTLTPK
jgi:Nickel responsive protein SCO4226-like